MTDKTQSLSSELLTAMLAISLAQEAATETPPDTEAMESAFASAGKAIERAQRIIQSVRCDMQANLNEL